MRFREIEHKYVVSSSFDINAFIETVNKLAPKGETKVQVRDTYYVVKACPGHVFRHRLDQEIQQLTVKSLQDDPENRLEVNLSLGLLHGNQGDNVAAFLTPLTIQWQGTIQKDVTAFYFDDCEIVFYQASFDGRQVACVEFEAKDAVDLATARHVLQKYEKALGFSGLNRVNESLVELLVLPNLTTAAKSTLGLR